MDTAKTNVLKKTDAFSEVVIVDPVTVPIARVLAGWEIHPITITVFAFIARLISAGFFLLGHGAYGAISSIVGFFLDGIDGKIARIRHLDEELHGTIDFLLDQVAFGVMAVAAIFWAVHAGYPTEATLLGGWLAGYMILMAFSATWFRVLSQNSISFKAGVGEAIFTENFQAGTQGFVKKIIRRVGNKYVAAKNALARYRMIPYPGTIESEVAVFMIAPFFHFKPILLALGILFLIPDIVISSSLSVIKVLNARRPQ